MQRDPFHVTVLSDTVLVLWARSGVSASQIATDWTAVMSCAVAVVTKWNALSRQTNATASSTTAVTLCVKTALLWSTSISAHSGNKQINNNLFFACSYML